MNNKITVFVVILVIVFSLFIISSLGLKNSDNQNSIVSSFNKATSSFKGLVALAINTVTKNKEDDSMSEVTVPPKLNLSQFTAEFLNLTNEYKQTPSEKRQDVSSRLYNFAKLRKDKILSEIATNPKGVIDSSISNTVSSELSQDIKSLIEQKISVKGKFEVFHYDNRDGTSKFEFFVTDELTGRKFNLHFPIDKLPKALTGDIIQATGINIDNEIALEDGLTSVQLLAATTPVIPPNTFGTQRTLVILVNFSDKVVEPNTISQIQTVMNTTSSFDLENSYNQTSLTGVVDAGQSADVRGWYTIPLSSTVCDTTNLATQAKQAATSAGVNLSLYNRYVYAFPMNACSWWGLAGVGGNPSQSWINDDIILNVVGHEMGHNFGLYHSHSMKCDSATCTSSDYGDSYDIMGASGSEHFNVFQKERLGWLNYNVSPPLTTVTSSGSYTIGAYELNNSEPKGLKILKTPSVDNNNNYYYVEYRTGIGFNANKSAVIVHTGSPLSGNSSYLWDLDQQSTAYDWVLNVGQTYSDLTAGVTNESFYYRFTNKLLFVSRSINISKLYDNQ
jgi:hypothetical protein